MAEQPAQAAIGAMDATLVPDGFQVLSNAETNQVVLVFGFNGSQLKVLITADQNAVNLAEKFVANVKHAMSGIVVARDMPRPPSGNGKGVVGH